MYISTVDYYEYFKKFRHRLAYLYNLLYNEGVQLQELAYYGATLDTFMSRSNVDIVYSDNEQHTYLKLLKELNEQPSEVVQYFNDFVDYLYENNMLNRITRLKLRLSKVSFLIRLFRRLLDMYKDYQEKGNNNEDFRNFIQRVMNYYKDLLNNYDNTSNELSEMMKKYENTDYDTKELLDKLEDKLSGVLDGYGGGINEYFETKLSIERAKQLMKAFDISIELYKYMSGKERTTETFDIVKMSSYGELKNAVGISKLLLSGDERLKLLSAYKIGNKEIIVRRRRVEEVSPYYIILFDFSGSMAYNEKYIIASSLILAFLLRYKDNVELITFMDTVVDDVTGKNNIIDFLVNRAPLSGGTSYYSGLQYVVNKVDMLKKKYKDVRLIIVGDLEDTNSLEYIQNIKDKLDEFSSVYVIFVSTINNENRDLYNFFKEHYTVYQITDLDTLIKSAKKIVL